ncbi:serine dehydratase beta chain [Amphritea sp.]
MAWSIPDLFKVGIGSASSHTVEPMVVNRFTEEAASCIRRVR